MKKVLFVLLAGFILTACTKEDATAAPVVSEPAAKVVSPETKQICKDVKDKSGNVVKNKDGTVKQTCKTIKVHKKFDGTKVPPK